MNYNFCINDFEGPLDLLLHLVKSNQMDIYEIDASTIIDQYLSFINSLEEMNIDVASEYLVMASELIHLKSKLLLNIEDDSEENDEYSINSEEDLKEKLKIYEQYKNISNDLRELEEKRNEVYTKSPESLSEYTENKTISNSEITLEDLIKAFLEYKMREKLTAPLATKITRKEYSVADKIKNIREVLKHQKKVNFMELFDSFTKENVVVTLLSILEMSKNDEIEMKQERNFSEIIIGLRGMI